MVNDIAKELGLDVSTDYKPNKDIEKLFKEREEERVDLLKEAIADINNMIKDRESLHKSMLKSLDKLTLFIDNNTPKLSASSASTMQVQGDLIKEMMKKKIEIEELKMQEELNFWRDVASLKKELREHMKEFREMQSKTTMLDTMLE